MGPDNHPNEIFIEASERLLEIYREILNKIHKSEDIPAAWLVGEIKLIYKGKGSKGKCSTSL